MKRKLLLFLTIFTLFGGVSYAEENSKCEYVNEIKQCNTANKNNTTREIEDFICINKKNENFTYQIILDAEFKKVDEKIEQYISDLETNKGYYFGKNKQKSYLDAIDNIVDIFAPTGRFGEEYYNICSGTNITQKVLDCKGDPQLIDIFGKNNNTVEISNASIYFGKDILDKKNSTPCSRLAKQKLDIYKKVSYDILLLNKLQISKDEKKLFQQSQRNKYSEILSLFSINIGYVERIWAKWPAKIKNTSQG